MFVNKRVDDQQKNQAAVEEQQKALYVSGIVEYRQLFFHLIPLTGSKPSQISPPDK
jgi:hypothetical protein